MDENIKENELQENFELTGEDNTVEPELEDIEDNSSGKIKKLLDKLKVCEHEKMEHLENLQRAKAEFLNSKKRLEEERLRDKERAVNSQIEKLIPMCDSFKMAMANKEAWEAIDDVWRKGVEGIHNQLHNILDSYGVTEIHPEGETFDPNRHEAMSVANGSDDVAAETVVEVLQAGFERNGTIIRPAKVIISN